MTVMVLPLNTSLTNIIILETLSRAGSDVLDKYPTISSLKVVFLPQVSDNES